MKRWLVPILLTALVGAATLLAAFGCSKRVPKDPYKLEQQKVLMNKGRLVQDLARPANINAAKIEGITLVRGLLGTGADEPPSTYQQIVLQDLQRDVDQKGTAKRQIASLNTAIVTLSAIVPPGARVGDRLDVDVKLQPKSEATSIQGGYVEDAGLYQYVAADIIRRGYKLGKANGYVTLDPGLVEKNSPIALKQGKIIGGVVVARPRPIWLELKENERSAGVAQRVEDVVNKRFSYTKPGNAGKKKVAEAKSGATRINLEIPDEYRDNVVRYVNVVCAISFYETEDELNERVDKLALQLLNPETSEFASVQLEAIGSNNAKVVDAIKRGLESSDDSVRFNSALTSAYFNLRAERKTTAKILAEFAANNPKYRPAALATLGVCMRTSFDVDAELRQLLSASSAETRYGAFRALWTRNPSDYMIQGENMANQFSYHCLNCGGPALVHLTQSVRPEIALFEADQIFLQGEFEIEANPRLTIRSVGDDIVVKKYETNDGIDEERRVGYRLDETIRAIVEIGGTYPDVVSFLTQAKKNALLRASAPDGSAAECPLAIDALPNVKPTHFQRVRDVEAIAAREEAKEKAAEKETKKSVWAKMNPSTWFQKEEEKTNENFDLNDFDSENVESDDEEFEGGGSDENSDESTRASDENAAPSDEKFAPDENDSKE